MSLLISHRGNTTGMNPVKENSPEYVQSALNKGFHVVVDVWLVGRAHLSLGAEQPRFPTTIEFLTENNIVCRAKSAETLEYLLVKGAHCFMHDKDNHVLTNGGLIWTAPGKPIMSRSILTMPEHVLPDISSLALLTCAGVCSDRIQEIKDKREELETQQNATEAEVQVKTKEIPHHLREEHICNCPEVSE
jgi:hypothetical protein